LGEEKISSFRVVFVGYEIFVLSHLSVAAFQEELLAQGLIGNRLSILFVDEGRYGLHRHRNDRNLGVRNKAAD